MNEVIVRPSHVAKMAMMKATRSLTGIWADILEADFKIAWFFRPTLVKVQQALHQLYLQTEEKLEPIRLEFSDELERRIAFILVLMKCPQVGIVIPDSEMRYLLWVFTKTHTDISIMEAIRGELAERYAELSSSKEPE